jgi:hypothetical protein
MDRIEAPQGPALCELSGSACNLGGQLDHDEAIEIAIESGDGAY